MDVIEKQYIVNENHETIAVQIDIKTFEKLEEILENYALVQLMKETEEEPALDLDKAKLYYQHLEKTE